MLTPNYLMNIAEPMVESWSQLECDIISDIVRRLVKNAGKTTDAADWQILKAREMGILQTDLVDQISKQSKISKRQVKEIVTKACKDSLILDDEKYLKKGYQPQRLTQSDALMNVVNAGIAKTNGLMENFTRTTANTASKVFEDCLDRAYMQIISGAFSFDSAFRSIVRELSSKGLQRVVYPSGSSIQMDSAVRRALVTGINQTAAQVQLANMELLGTNLVQVSAHAGARPSHAKWQGGIYWYGKPVSGYRSLEEATGYGSGDGLCGWNCYHTFFPYIDGISKPSYSGDPSRERGKSNDQMYEESQKQREYERKIRELRRECAAYAAAQDAAGSDEEEASMAELFSQAAVKLKKKEADLDKFCEETGRTKVTNRLFVPSYGRSESAKATWAYRRYLK